jgi:hypothetical protein
MGGVYCENCDIAPLQIEKTGDLDIGDAMQIVGVMPYAADAETAECLWKLSEGLVFRNSNDD